MKKILKEWLPYVIIIIIVILIRTYVITPVIVRGSSMENTLHEGEVLLLSKISYKINDIKRYDIVVIKDNDCSNGIPKGKYLVLGDNRDVSADSIIKGLIDKEQITGKTIFRLWPLNKLKIIK